jgi:peptide/nickel transport system ATP-binding protein
MALLEVENLQTHFATPDGVVRAVEGVSFHIDAGETLGIVGESGCGKSVTAMSILRLVQEPPGKIAGAIRLQGRNLLELDEPAMRDIRGNAISMIFQEPMTSLNPVLTVGRQIGETLQLHQGLSPREAEKRSIDMLVLVGIPAPQRRVREYPHQLSGGMRQRVMIAMALALEPEIVIMDEPTTALDVVVQREILDEIERLRARLGFSVIFITHDLSLLLEISDRLAVMYAGEVVEYSPSEQIAVAPAHPYTLGLLRSFPDLRGARRELRGVPGVPPDLRDSFPGCPFQPRCDYAFGPCTDVHPELSPVSGHNRYAACHLHDPRHRPDGPPAELSGAAADPIGADSAGGER